MSDWRYSNDKVSDFKWEVMVNIVAKRELFDKVREGLIGIG
jgi:hypothetical protein